MRNVIKLAFAGDEPQSVEHFSRVSEYRCSDSKNETESVGGGRTLLFPFDAVR